MSNPAQSADDNNTQVAQSRKAFEAGIQDIDAGDNLDEELARTLQLRALAVQSNQPAVVEAYQELINRQTAFINAGAVALAKDPVVGAYNGYTYQGAKKVALILKSLDAKKQHEELYGTHLPDRGLTRRGRLPATAQSAAIRASAIGT